MKRDTRVDPKAPPDAVGGTISEDEVVIGSPDSTAESAQPFDVSALKKRVMTMRTTDGGTVARMRREYR